MTQTQGLRPDWWWSRRKGPVEGLCTSRGLGRSEGHERRVCQCLGESEIILLTRSHLTNSDSGGS